MKRTMVWLLGLVASLVTTLAFANATAFTVAGSVSAQTGAAAARTVRQGDTLRAGDTVTTGAGSSAVLKFEDGQIAALGPNSRMVIQAFEYNAQAKSGNIVLTLLSGGMRAITGLIGRANPQRVTYRAGNYTIGIRGTDVNIVTDGSNVVVTVTEGLISFTFGTQTITVTAGEGVNARTDGTFQRSAIDTIIQQLQATPEGRNLLDAIRGVQTIQAAVSQAATGVSGTVTPTPSGPVTTTGGGTGSPR
jgi:hypothetical protein